MRLKKKIGMLAAACALMLAMTGCGGGSTQTTAGTDSSAAQPGGTLKVAINAQPLTLDPPMTTATITRDISRNIFETLVTLNSKLQVVPMLAKSIDESKDGKTYTFHLRKGIKFHNGKEMTSDDVVASMNRWKDKSSRGKAVLNGGEFKTQGADTVVLTLKTASMGVLPAMAGQGQFAAIMPKEVVEAAGPSGVKDYIGTGPFKFVEWKKDQFIHLTKFKDYKPVDKPADGLAGKREALVDDLIFNVVTDGSTRVAGIQTGEYDVALQVPTDNYDQLKSNASLKNYLDLNGILALVFNKKQGPSSNVKLRQAINNSLDMDKIMLAAFSDQKFYRLSSSYMLKENSDWYSENGKDQYNQKDLEKAKALLKEAGYNGQELRLLVTRDYDYMYNAGIVIKQQLEKVGVKVKLDVTDWATLLTKRQDASTWDMFITGFSTVNTPMELLYLSPTFPGWTNDPKIADLMKKVNGAPTKEEAKKYWDEAQGLSWQYLPIVNLGDDYLLTVATDKVKGFKSFLGPVVWNTTVSK